MPQDRSGPMKTVYKVVCSALQEGLTGWVAKRLRSTKANFFVNLALEAAFTFCPTAADQIMS